MTKSKANEAKKFIIYGNPGSGSKLGQNSKSGSKFNVFGSTTLDYKIIIDIMYCTLTAEKRSLDLTPVMMLCMRGCTARGSTCTNTIENTGDI